MNANAVDSGRSAPTLSLKEQANLALRLTEKYDETVDGGLAVRRCADLGGTER
jgi:hypothetical protein